MDDGQQRRLFPLTDKSFCVENLERDFLQQYDNTSVHQGHIPDGPV